MRFPRFGVTLKLGIISGVLLVSLIVITLISLNNISKAQENLNQIVNDVNVKVAVTGTMVDMIKDVQIYIRNIAMATDAQKMRDELKKLQAARSLYDESESRLENIFTTENDKAQFARAKELRVMVRPLADHAIQLGLQNKDKEAIAIITNEVEPITRQRLAVFLQIIEEQKMAGEKAATEMTTAHAHAQILILALGFLALILGMVITIVIMVFAMGMDKAGSTAGSEM